MLASESLRNDNPKCLHKKREPYLYCQPKPEEINILLSLHHMGQERNVLINDELAARITTTLRRQSAQVRHCHSCYTVLLSVLS